MYCKNCGRFVKEKDVFCPNCGSPIGIGNYHLKQSNKHPYKRQKNIRKYVFIGIFILLVVLFGIRIKKLQSREPTSAAITDKTTISESEKEVSLIGIWKSKQGEVTFTESGNMMLGKGGIVLGGGWLQYEIVDDTTLYVSGGDFPVGLSMKYNLNGESLSLEVKGSTMVFTKD